MDLECPYCGFIGDECEFVHYEDSEVCCPRCSEHFRIQEYEDEYLPSDAVARFFPEKFGFWRSYYISISPPLLLFLVGAFVAPTTQDRLAFFFIFVLFGSFWLDGFFRVAPSLDGERDK